MTTSSLLLVVAVVASAFVAHGEEFTWSATNPQTSFGGGLVTVTLDESRITGFATESAGNIIRFKGDQMTFADGATIASGWGELIFDNALVAEGRLTVSGTGQMDFSYDENIPADKTLYAAGFAGDLDEFAITYAYLNSTAISETVRVATPCCIAATTDEMSAQLQTRDGSYLKCVKVRLWKEDGNLYAQSIYARALKYGNVGAVDFDAIPDGTPDYLKLAIAATDSGYIVGRLKISRMAGINVTAAGGARLEGALELASNVTFTAIGADAVVEDGRLTKSVMLDQGTLVLQDSGSVEFATPLVSVTGGGFVSRATDAMGARDVQMAEDGSSVPSWASGWTVIAKGAVLSSLNPEGMSATLNGSAIGSEVKAGVYHVVNDGRTASFQVQYQAGIGQTLKGCVIALRQNGADVEMKALDSRYILGGNSPRAGDDLQGETSTAYPTGYTMSNVYVSGLSFQLAAQQGVTIPAAVENGWANVAIRVEGTDTHPSVFSSSGASGWPVGGSLTIDRGGIVEIANNNASYDVGYPGRGSCVVNVRAGGELRQLGCGVPFCNAFDPNQVFNVKGGTVYFGYGETGSKPAADSVDTAGSTYAATLNLSDGARVKGKAVRVGAVREPCTWTVGGSAPSVFEPGVSAVGSLNNETSTWVVVVNDVTGGAEEDFTIQGGIGCFTDGNTRNFRLVKRGDGTLRIDTKVECNRLPLCVEDGFLMPGGTGVFTSEHDVELRDGGLATVANTTNSVGDLTVEGICSLSLADGSELDFADASSLTWANGSILNIVGDLGKSRVRFGSSATSLTPAQLRCIRYGGRKVSIDADGYINGTPPGLLMIFR